MPPFVVAMHCYEHLACSTVLSTPRSHLLQVGLGLLRVPRFKYFDMTLILGFALPSLATWPEQKLVFCCQWWPSAPPRYHPPHSNVSLPPPILPPFLRPGSHNGVNCFFHSCYARHRLGSIFFCVFIGASWELSAAAGATNLRPPPIQATSNHLI